MKRSRALSSSEEDEGEARQCEAGPSKGGKGTGNDMIQIPLKKKGRISMTPEAFKILSTSTKVHQIMDKRMKGDDEHVSIPVDFVDRHFVQADVHVDGGHSATPSDGEGRPESESSRAESPENGSIDEELNDIEVVEAESPTMDLPADGTGNESPANEAEIAEPLENTDNVEPVQANRTREDSGTSTVGYENIQEAGTQTNGTQEAGTQTNGTSGGTCPTMSFHFHFNF